MKPRVSSSPQPIPLFLAHWKYPFSHWHLLSGAGIGDISILASGEQYHSDMARVVNKVYTFGSQRCKQSMQIRLLGDASTIFTFAIIVPTGWPGTHYDCFSLMKEKF